MKMMPTPATMLLTLSLAGMSGACGVAPEESSAPENLAQSRSALDPSYFCVDHPCADLQALYFAWCPVRRGILTLGVKNVGNYTAWPSKTRLTLGGVNAADYDFPSLAPGTQRVIGVAVPQWWIDQCNAATSGAPCSWKVTADATDLSREPNASNNVVSGNCYGALGGGFFAIK